MSMKSKQSPMQRIQQIMNYYLRRGGNSERANNVYRKILRQKLERDN